MVIKILAACVIGFFISLGIGKVYIPWLNRHQFSQPIKEQVAEIYAERERNPSMMNGESNLDL